MSEHILDGSCVLVRALSQVAIEMAVRICAPPHPTGSTGDSGSAQEVGKGATEAQRQAEVETEEEDRRRIVTWLELVAMLLGETVGSKVSVCVPLDDALVSMVCLL